MSHSTLRRTGAFLASVGLLASLTVATLAAPVSAGGCELWTGGDLEDQAEPSCYYVTSPITTSPYVGANVTLNGSDAKDSVSIINGTFNGGGGDDEAYSVSVSGTFNDGPGNDFVAGYANFGTFNGGPDNDYVSANLGTFNGGGGVDLVTSNYGTFAGGGGSDCYGENTGTVWSAALGYWDKPGVCTLY